MEIQEQQPELTEPIELTKIEILSKKINEIKYYVKVLKITKTKDPEIIKKLIAKWNLIITNLEEQNLELQLNNLNDIMATFEETNNITINEKFREFHKKNPMVYVLFQKQVEKALQKGMNKISAKTLLGYIRWEINIKTTSEDFKINDAFTSRYARLFIKKNPKYIDLFNLRKLRAA